jgi:TnpA family transposase
LGAAELHSAETLSGANACLVDAQARIPLAQAFGGGEVASADGLRFVVPVRTNGLASHRLKPKLITQNWDDFLRVAGVN